MRRVIAIFAVAVLASQSFGVGTALARTNTTSINLQPQKVVELSATDRVTYFPNGQYTDLIGTDLTSRLDAGRADNPAWQTSANNYPATNAWVGAKYTFDTKAILQCAQDGIIRVRQRGSYTATALAKNAGSTEYNDAKQLLISNGAVLQTIKFPGGIAPGASKTTLSGTKINLTRGQLSKLELLSTIQVKDQTNKIDWGVDNLSLNVEYIDSCSKTAERYAKPIFTEVDEFINIPYRNTTLDNGQPTTLKLDVFRPKNDQVKFRPLIVFIHGGGYTWGSKEDINYAARWYAKAGFTTASIDYRLMTNGGQDPPIDKIIMAFYDSLLDTKDAIRFLSNRGGSYGIDSNKIAVVGWSAGGATAMGQQLARSAFDPGSAISNFSPNSLALVSGSGYLGPPLFPEMRAKKPNVLMINWQSDTANSDEMNQDNNSFAKLTCNAFLSAGTSCSLVLKPGSGHDIDFIQESATVLPFIRTQLRL